MAPQSTQVHTETKQLCVLGWYDSYLLLGRDFYELRTLFDTICIFNFYSPSESVYLSNLHDILITARDFPHLEPYPTASVYSTTTCIQIGDYVHSIILLDVSKVCLWEYLERRNKLFFIWLKVEGISHHLMDSVR